MECNKSLPSFEHFLNKRKLENLNNNTPSNVAETNDKVVKKKLKRGERWTESEHELFLIGLEKYGRKWKKIQLLLQTKTSIQVRTHAYGYFAKLLRNLPSQLWEEERNSEDIQSILSRNKELSLRGFEILKKHVLVHHKTDLPFHRYFRY